MQKIRMAMRDEVNIKIEIEIAIKIELVNDQHIRGWYTIDKFYPKDA